MSLYLRIILIVASFISAMYVIRKIRKSQMKIGDSMYWILIVALIVFFSVFPTICYYLAICIGVESPVNLIFLLMIFLLMGKVFSLSVKNSQLEYKVTMLTEEIAIWRNSIETNYSSVADINKD